MLESQGQDNHKIVSVLSKGKAIVVANCIFILPYAVIPEFFDVNNSEVKPFIDLHRSSERASFFLKKQPEFLSPVWSTFRRCTTVPRPFGTGPCHQSRATETEQEQENRKYNFNINNNNTSNVVDGKGDRYRLLVNPNL